MRRTSGLSRTTSTVVGLTFTPGWIGSSSTRPLVRATTLRTYSGLSVPGALTSRVISPRLTVSIHSVPRSTGGAAGFSPLITTVIPPMATMPTAQPMICLVFLGGSRLISKVTSRAEGEWGRDTSRGELRKVHAEHATQITNDQSITCDAQATESTTADARKWECTSHNRTILTAPRRLWFHWDQRAVPELQHCSRLCKTFES